MLALKYITVKLAKRDAVPLYRLRGRDGEGATGITSFITQGSTFAMPVRARSPSRQKGVTLMITLIMLVVMTLSAIALIRSTDTSNLIAGNVAFQQGATNSAQQGIQQGLSDLASLNNTAALIQGDPNEPWYSPVSCNPTQHPIEWWAWWNSHTCTSISGATTSFNPNNAGTDASFNTVFYVIERLCSQKLDTRDPNNLCQVKAVEDTANPPFWNAAQLYRITAFVSGPRGTQSLVQAIVSQ